MMGLVPLCTEGAPIHPDKFDFFGTDEAYLKRLQAYSDFYGYADVMKVMCSRPELLSMIEKSE